MWSVTSRLHVLFELVSGDSQPPAADKARRNTAASRNMCISYRLWAVDFCMLIGIESPRIPSICWSENDEINSWDDPNSLLCFVSLESELWLALTRRPLDHDLLLDLRVRWLDIHSTLLACFFAFLTFTFIWPRGRPILYPPSCHHILSNVTAYLIVASFTHVIPPSRYKQSLFQSVALTTTLFLRKYTLTTSTKTRCDLSFFISACYISCFLLHFISKCLQDHFLVWRQLPRRQLTAEHLNLLTRIAFKLVRTIWLSWTWRRHAPVIIGPPANEFSSVVCAGFLT